MKTRILPQNCRQQGRACARQAGDKVIDTGRVRSGHGADVGWWRLGLGQAVLNFQSITELCPSIRTSAANVYKANAVGKQLVGFWINRLKIWLGAVNFTCPVLPIAIIQQPLAHTMRQRRRWRGVAIGNGGEVVFITAEAYRYFVRA